MNTIDKLSVFDNIDEKYIVEAIPHRILAYGTSYNKKSAKQRHPLTFFEGLASVAAVVLVLGVILVWSIVGKDILKAQKGDDTTVDTTTAPITTPDNVIVPPITDNTANTTTPQIYVPETTTVPITTPVTPPVTTPTTTTVPITTTQPPVTTTTPVTTKPIILAWDKFTVHTADSSILENKDVVKFTDPKAEYINQYLVFTAQGTITDIKFFTTVEDESGYQVGEVLFTLDKLTPDKPLVISTYLNDANINRGISFIAEYPTDGLFYSYGLGMSMKGNDDNSLYVEEINGFNIFCALTEEEIIAIYKEIGCADNLLPSGILGKVSDNEFEKIKTFFNDTTTYRFIPTTYLYTQYFTPDDIYLHSVIMGNYAPVLSEVSEEEEHLLPDAAKKSFIFKLTTAQLKELYKKYLGIDFDPAIHGDGAVYLEEYDSYYAWGGLEGPPFTFDKICAWKTENESVIVLFEDTGGILYFATLKPTQDSYIFLQVFDSGYPYHVKIN